MTESPEQNRETFGRLADLPIPPLQYYKLVRNFNNLIQAELREKLKEKAEHLGTAVTLVTGGSDGRREKGSLASPLEITAILDADIDPDVFKKTLISVIREASPTRISKIVEIKGPRSNLAFFNDDPHRVQPGRIADSRLIYGSPENIDAAKKRLGKEILSLPRRTIVDRVESLEKDGRKATERGRNRIGGTDAIHFDIESGVVYFNPEAHQLSFKIGPLRLVQNTLLAEEVKHTRHEGDADFISRLASGVVSRLTELSDDKMVNLTKESVQEITEHYAFFLRLYHRSEQAYTQRGKTSVQLEKSEVEEVAKRLQALLALMKKFKIQKRVT